MSEESDKKLTILVDQLESTAKLVEMGVTTDKKNLVEVLRTSCETIKDLLKTVETIRESLDDQVANLFKIALATDTTYDREGLVFELTVYAESLFCRLLENIWYNGDYDGQDSKAYFECERDLIRVITLAQNLNKGEPIEINTLKHFPIVQMHEWTHLTKDAVLAVREENEWLKLGLDPANTANSQ